MVRALLIAGMRASRWLTVTVTAFLLALGAIGRQEAVAAEPAEACRTYRVVLQTARQALAGGQRDAALAALQQAKALLEKCRREERRNTTVVAMAGAAGRITSNEAIRPAIPRG